MPSNIHFGQRRDGPSDRGRIADAVRDADLLALREAERDRSRSGTTDQPLELAALLPDHHRVSGLAMDLDASSTDRAGPPVHRRRQLGNLLLPRTPIISTRWFPLPKLGTVAQYSLQRVALEEVATGHGGGRDGVTFPGTTPSPRCGSTTAPSARRSSHASERAGSTPMRPGRIASPSGPSRTSDGRRPLARAVDAGVIEWTIRRRNP